MCCGWDYILLDYFLEFMKNLMLDDKQLTIVVAFNYHMCSNN